ncbi:MAG: ATP-binding protein [Bacteroidales bacterium]|nr:ATP-binding protein [Bacteroidales bacterium]
MINTLIIGNNTESNELLSDMLKDISTVKSLVDIENIKSEIDSNQYDIVLINLCLSNYAELVYNLIEICKKYSAVIVVSTTDYVDQVCKCMELGAADVLICPFHKTSVRLRIEAAIRRNLVFKQSKINELEAERHKYKLLFENMSSGFVLVKKKHDNYFVVEANDSALKIFNLSKEKAIGLELHDFKPSFSKEFFDELDVIITSRTPKKIEKFSEPIGKYLSFNIYSPEPSFAAMIVDDLSNLKTQMNAIRELNFAYKRKVTELDDKNSQLELLLEGSNDGTWDYDMIDESLNVNPQYKHQLGYEEEDNIFNNITDFINVIYDQENKTKFFEIFKNIKSNKQSLVNEELRVKCKDGSIKWINARCVVKRDEDGNVIRVAGVNTDISERKAYEEILKNKSLELEKANDTKNMFISIIAHDLRNPFNAIIGLTGLLLKRENIKSDSRTFDIVSIISQSAQNTYEMLNNLLLWCRTQQNSIAFNPDNLNLHNVVEDALRDVKILAQKKHIMLINSTNTDDIIWADGQMLQTIIRNLATNSVKFTNEGGLIIASSEINENSVDFIIEDNGVGMTQDVVDKLMIISKNKSTVGTGGETGSGMGLLICKEFIDKHNGTVKVESFPGKGSKFIISFPNKKD